MFDETYSLVSKYLTKIKILYMTIDWTSHFKLYTERAHVPHHTMNLKQNLEGIIIDIENIEREHVYKPTCSPVFADVTDK